jgi:hypothetical protein
MTITSGWKSGLDSIAICLATVLQDSALRFGAAAAGPAGPAVVSRPLLLGCAVEFRKVRNGYRVWAGARNVVPRSKDVVRGLQFTEEIDRGSGPVAVNGNTMCAWNSVRYRLRHELAGCTHFLCAAIHFRHAFGKVELLA